MKQKILTLLMAGVATVWGGAEIANAQSTTQMAVTQNANSIPSSAPMPMGVPSRRIYLDGSGVPAAAPVTAAAPAPMTAAAPAPATTAAPMAPIVLPPAGAVAAPQTTAAPPPLSSATVFGSRNKKMSFCLSSIQVSNPRVVMQKGGRAVVEMDVTNMLAWSLTDFFLRYGVYQASTGRLIKTDPVALTVDPIPPGTTAKVQTPFFGLRWVKSPKDLTARIEVKDIADPEGNQLVREQEIAGVGWTGRRSPMGCRN